MAPRAVLTIIALAMLAYPGGVSARDLKYRYRSHPTSHFYLNQNGYNVHRPVFNNSRPTGATAQCADGSWSFSQHRRGTCSRHGGVASW
jgi:hypothetical protein